MSLDIIIFAVVAAVLVARLKSILGTKHGDERDRPNPFSAMGAADAQKAAAPVSGIDADAENVAHTLVVSDKLIKAEDPEVVKAGLKQIAAADHSFSLGEFLHGSRMAFQMITEAFAEGDRKTLKSLLGDDLYKSFERAIETREGQNYTASYELHRIKDARIADARLGGVMAYVTVDFDVEQTSIIKDADGKTVDGDPDKIAEVHDIWTFARDVRSDDPNWELVSTRIGDG